LTFISVFKSLLLSYTSLDLFFSLKSLSAALFPSSRKQWLECVHDDHPSCFDPHIICDEANGFYQYYSKCYEISTQRIPGNPNFTWAQVVVGMTSTSEALRELPTQIYLFEKIRALDRPSPFLFASAVVQQAIIAFIGILGMRAYAKVRFFFFFANVARLIVVFPLVCLLFCMIFAVVKLGGRDALIALSEGLKPNLSKLMTVRAWSGALLHVSFEFASTRWSS
uniref:ABC transmembrane type-1 domain-containing protein n=1 Tax=Gongylonema pulchrum TaxID=637853 RepID=A0A183E9D6_9BILA